MTELRFYIDPETDQPHIYNHSVREQDVEEAWRRRLEDHPSTGNSRVMIGQTFSGRYIRVVYVPDEDRKGAFVVTAYPLTGNPLKAFRRRFRRRQL